MYAIVRMILASLLGGLAIIILEKFTALRKRVVYTVAISISMLFCIALVFWPFENLFVTFDSPDAAYEYFNPGNSNIVLTIEGDACDFVIDRKDNSDSILMIPKNQNGWKVGIGSNTKRITHQASNGIIISVYQYKNTNDYFITILDTEGGESIISDDYDTVFYPLEEKNEFLGEIFVTYYAHVSNFDSQYSVVVNGSKIVFQNQ